MAAIRSPIITRIAASRSFLDRTRLNGVLTSLLLPLKLASGSSRGDLDRHSFFLFREMGAVKALLLLAIVFVLAEMPQALGFPATAPAFLWSPQHYGSSDYVKKEFVDYRTISPKDLARLVMAEGGWSNVVCSQKNLDEKMDVAVVFIGRKLQSWDISSSKQQDPSLIDLLKSSFTTSNISMAFPYVAIHEQETLENSLIKWFSENCAQGLGVNRISYLDSCSVNGQNLEKLQGLHSVQDLLASRVSGKTDLIVLCSGSSEDSDNTKSEGEVFSHIINLLKQFGAKYTVLYASKPNRAIQYPVHLSARFLEESSSASASTNSTCDGVCQIKSSLLEGFFVALVLLIILISGLCCMAGIDTPTRFEAPQES